MNQNTKIGRPTDNPKMGQYRLRLTEEDALMLAFCAKQNGISKADVLREGLKLIYEKTIKKQG